jgi:HlyD family secretion protein
MNSRILKLTGVAVTATAIFAGWRVFGRSETPTFTRANVERGDIVKTISATGKLQAVVTVQVGSQVSGRIAELHADFNSRVTKGQIVARLDPSLFQAQLAQSQANLANAHARLETAGNAVANQEASLASAAANRDRVQAARNDSERAYRSMQQVADTGAVSSREVETAQAALAQADAQLQQAAAQVEQARAQLSSARSQVNEARASVKQQQAAVELAQANLGYTIIRAPIDGVVIARNVDVGQTVAASLQAPTLFLIANDLTRMQVLADIDEADVGQLSESSKVSFTVDAYPRDTFNGRVSQIRLNPQTVQNVVTYTAVIDVANPELKLRPGMTATVTATVAESRDALRVPNAALRFRAGEARGPAVWKLEGKDQLTPVRVKPGITDGAHTEILSGNLNAGDQIVTGQETAAAGRTTATRNPMMPMGGPRTGARR